jgi:hypothetical protein
MCGQIQSGQSKEEVVKIIEKSKYQRYLESNDIENSKYQLIILSDANRGRHTCVVEHNGKTVMTAVPLYSD